MVFRYAHLPGNPRDRVGKPIPPEKHHPAFPVQGVQKAVQRLTQCLRRPGLLGGGSGQAALQLYQGEIPAFIPPLGVIMAVAVQGYIPGNPADKGQQGIGPVGRDGVP